MYDLQFFDGPPGETAQRNLVETMRAADPELMVIENRAPRGWSGEQQRVVELVADGVPPEFACKRAALEATALTDARLRHPSGVAIEISRTGTGGLSVPYVTDDEPTTLAWFRVIWPLLEIVSAHGVSIVDPQIRNGFRIDVAKHFDLVVSTYRIATEMATRTRRRP